MTAGTACSRRLCVYFSLPSCYRYASVNYKLLYVTMKCLLSYILWEDRNMVSEVGFQPTPPFGGVTITWRQTESP